MKASQSITRRQFLGWSVLAAGALAGCAGPTRTPQVVEKVVKETVPVEKVVKETVVVEKEAPASAVKLDYWTWFGTAESYNKRMTDMIGRFQEDVPGITVEYLPIPYGEFLTKFATSYAGGVGPDLIYMDCSQQGFFGSQNVVIDLLPLALRDSDFPRQDFIPSSVEMFDWAGKQLGYPVWLMTAHIAYNDEIFSKAGATTPLEAYEQGEWNWNTYLEMARTLTQQDSSGQVSVFGTSLEGPYALFLWSNGGDHFDDNQFPTKCLYDLPESIEGFQFRADLRNKHKVASAPEQLGTTDTDAFRAGKIAMLPYWGLQKDNWAPVNYGIVPFPKGPSANAEYATDFTTECYSILSTSRHIEEAWRFIKWVMTKDYEWEASQPNPKGIPSRQSLWEETVNQLAATPEVVPDLLKYGHVRPVSKDWPKMNTQLIAPELDKLWLGQEAAATVCPRITQAVNDFLAANPQ